MYSLYISAKAFPDIGLLKSMEICHEQVNFYARLIFTDGINFPQFAGLYGGSRRKDFVSKCFV